MKGELGVWGKRDGKYVVKRVKLILYFIYDCTAESVLL